MAKLLLLNGPNLNLLGSREPEIYGSDTLASIFVRLEEQVQQHKEQHHISQFQSNSESKLVDKIHQASQDGVDFILINPAAFTHTSIAIRDALLGTKIPFIEIHLSNVHKREEFRQHSYFSDIAVGTIVGLGAQGYELALQAAMRQLDE
ncbi:MAG: type II 3-dehydroquinate dehydratase [Cocleimonas sp.]|nr:type II 3-dehydroquinate dehydratase [Cocleimonas sp.]